MRTCIPDTEKKKREQKVVNCLESVDMSPDRRHWAGAQHRTQKTTKKHFWMVNKTGGGGYGSEKQR